MHGGMSNANGKNATGDLNTRGGRPEVLNVEFYASRHDRDDSSVDKDRYDLLAVIPYDEEKMNIISDNIIFDTCINIFDKYIVWQIRDISPIDSDFPITLVAPVIDEIYFKMTKVKDIISTMNLNMERKWTK